VREFGIIFDWDGVIIDSSGHHLRSWELLAEETGYVLPEDHFEKSFGQRNERIIPELLDWTQDLDEVRQLSLRKEVLYRECMHRDGVEPMAGVVPFLRRLKAGDVPRIVGSSTHRQNIQTIINMTGLETYFSDMVTAEDVERGKPDPDCFLKAAVKLGLASNRCIVFEDALVGIEAAQAAGMRVIAVATTNPASALRHADRVVDRLDEVTLDDLKALLGH
jgi:beta-phosphoglucomutase family hydrolase